MRRPPVCKARDHAFDGSSAEIMAFAGLCGRISRAFKRLARRWIICGIGRSSPGLIPPSPTSGQQLVGYTPGLCVCSPAAGSPSSPLHTPLTMTFLRSQVLAGMWKGRSSSCSRPSRPAKTFFPRRQVTGESNAEIACVASARLCQCPAASQCARVASTAGEAIGVSYRMSPPRPQLIVLRLPSPGIYIEQPSRSRPTAPTASCALSDRSVAFYKVFLYDVWQSALFHFEADTAICGSRCTARVEAHAIARRVLLPSPLCCGGRTVCGSGADLCVSLVPYSHCLLRRSIRLRDWRLPGRPGHAERAAQRPERVASVCPRVSARATEVWGRAALRACCAPCLWR